MTASYAFPLFSISCPGKIERTVSSSGAPKNIEGIKLIKTSEIDIATIKTARVIGSVRFKKKFKTERSKTEIKFI